MRKTLLLLICLFTMLSFFSCSPKQVIEEIEEESITSVDTIEEGPDSVFLDSLEYSLGNNLPTLSFNTKVMEYQITEEDRENELVASYYVINKFLTVNVLRYKTEGHSIQEVLDAQIETYYPDQKIISNTFDTWLDGYQCNYGYYMVYDTVTYEDPYYVQTFIFIDGDEFVETDYWYECSRINIDNGIYIDIPKSLVSEVDVLNATEGEILRYESEFLSGVPCFSIYKNENVEDDFDAIIENYNNMYSNVETNRYSVTKGNNKYNFLSLTYFEDDTMAVQVHDHKIFINGILYSFSFCNNTNNGLFDSMGIYSIISSINRK